MKNVKRTPRFHDWMAGLKNAKTAAIIAANIEKLRRGLGDIEPVGEGVSEIRINYGPGYRVYFGELAGQLIVLLVGGTKRRQQVDIDAANRCSKN